MRTMTIVGALLIGVAVAGCQSGPAENTPPVSTATSSPRPAGVGGQVAPPFGTRVSSRTVVTTPLLLVSPTITGTATVTETPTVTPTEGPPTPTLTPAPSASTLEAAQGLDQALVTFAQAAASGDSKTAFEAQRKLLELAAKTAPAAQADQSTYGQQLRSALGALKGGAAGDNDKIAEAHRALTGISGGVGVNGQQADTTPVAVLPRIGAQQGQSLPDVTKNLSTALDAYTNALNGGAGSDLLRAQRDLIDATNAADAATKNNKTPQGQQLQKALGSIHDGLGGDAGKFTDAQNTLASMGGSNGGKASGQAPKKVDLQPIFNDLDQKLQALQIKSTDQNQDNVKHAQDDLKASIQKATSALANDHSPAADKFRTAMDGATPALKGDFSKIQDTRDQLQSAAGQPAQQ